ncbi:MAG: gas vesicle protein [Planctomycetota bacterium]
METNQPSTKRRLKLRDRAVEHAGPPPSTPPGEVTLTETLDRVLSRGVVAQAEVVLAVADIPLVYVGVQALVASVEAARDALAGQEVSV